MYMTDHCHEPAAAAPHPPPSDPLLELRRAGFTNAMMMRERDWLSLGRKLLALVHNDPAVPEL